ncbi:MAG: FtsQ-type POTRA domain-containing protein [Deltaproteobacteria bacterium]|nr:FtsQ-type POTRA domain-containing protein [Deltaproteobacteria bacterium]
MAMEKNASLKGQRRVALRRPGSSGVKNRVIPRKKAQPRLSRSFSLPWRGLGRSLLLAASLCVGVLALLAMSVGLIYGYRALTRGPYFSLKNIEIQGISRLTSKEVLDITGLSEGGNSLALSIDVLEDALLRSPWVQSASVKRVLPDTLLVSVKEKEPAFWKLDKGVLMYADALGQPISPVQPGSFISLPTLEVEPGAEESARALPDLVRSLRGARTPLNMGSVSWVRLSAARGVEVFVEDLRLHVTIGFEDWLNNLQRLGRTIADLQARGELRFVRAIRAEGASVWVEKKTLRSLGG